MSEAASETSRPAPIGVSERIESIDVLRGVAVLGILALNIQSYAMPGSAYINPTAYGDLSGVNYWIWYSVHLLGDLKFWGIFSMLFGSGVLILTARCEATGRSAASIHFRRTSWLLIFGLLHAHLLWYGDILYAYGMCGLIIYFFRKRSPAFLIGLGMLLLLVATAISIGFGTLVASDEGADLKAELRQSWNPAPEKIQEELDTYRGNWPGQMKHRSPTAFFFETVLFLFSFGWRSAGLMLVGMALFKLGVLTAARSKAFYATCVALALFVALPIIAFGVHQNEGSGWALEYSFYFGPIYNFWASILVSLGWIGLVMLVCKTPALRPFTRPFAAAGRMALTCYLLQSLIATTIFYGHGLGQFGNLQRWQQMLVVLGIWILLLVFAPWWLRRFRYGPFEWLWRSLTYMKRQEIRIESPN